MSNINNIANALRTAMVSSLVQAPDAGSAAGRVKLYTAGKAILLVTMTLNDPAFTDPPVNGVASVSLSPAEPSGVAVAGGDAAVAVFLDSDDNVCFAGTVTATGGGGLITISSVTIVIGSTVRVTGGTITQPAS